LIKIGFGADESMIANRSIGEKIDAIYIQALFFGAPDGQKALNRRSGISDSGRIANNRERRFDDTALTVGYLQNGFARDLVDGRLKGTRQRSIHKGDGYNNANSERYTQESKQRPQAVALHMTPGKGSEQTQYHLLSFSTLPSRKKIVRSP
jgi:hypothetical protein